LIAYHVKVAGNKKVPADLHFLHHHRVNFILVVILISGVIFTELETGKTIESLHKKITDDVSKLTHAINPVLASHISFDESVYQALPENKKRRTDEAFSRIQSQMRTWAEANGLLRVYGLGFFDGKLHLGPDSNSGVIQPEEKKDFLEAGYDVELIKFFKNPQVFILDNDNIIGRPYVHAYAPLLSPRSGEVIMLMGVKKSLEQENRKIFRQRIFSLGFFLLLALFLFKGALILQKERRLSDGSGGFFIKHTEAVIVFFLGFFLSLFVAYNIYSASELLRCHIFERLAAGKAALMRKQIELLGVQYEGLASYFSGSERVDSVEFDEFAKHLIRRSSMVAWGFCPEVKRSGVTDFAKRIKAEKGMDFKIFSDPEYKNDIAVEESLFPITYLHPLKGNESVIGYDTYSEPLRRTAIKTAIHSDLPTATDPIYLIQDEKSILSVAIFQPLYNQFLGNGRRDRKFVGVAVLAIRLEAMLRIALFEEGAGDADITVNLHQMESNGSATNLLAVPFKTRTVDFNRLTNIYPFHFFGKNWILKIQPDSDFTSVNPFTRSFTALIFGFFISFLFASFVWFLRHQQIKLEEMVYERTVELDKSREWLSITLNSIGDAVVSTDIEGRVVHLNPVAEQMLGWKLEEVQGRPLSEIFCIYNSTTKKTVINPVEVVLNTGQVVGLANHTTLLARDGTEKQIADSAAPIKQADGETTGVVMVFSDVTRQYQVRRELQRIKAAVEQSAEGVAIAEVDGKIWFVNKAWADLHGYDDVKELFGRHLSIFHSEEQFEKEVKPFNEMVLRHGLHEGEVGHIRKDGSSFPSMMSTSVERDETGSICGLIAVMRDISAERLMQGRLQHSERMESIGRLAAGVAHDLNNFISPVMGYSEILYKNLQADMEKREQVGEIQKASESMRSLIQQLLAFGRQQEMSMSTRDLSEVIRNMEHLIRGAVHDNFQIDYLFSEKVMRACVDAHQLGRVIMNLVVNAQDSMSEVGVIGIKVEPLDLKIRHKMEHLLVEDMDYVTIAVSDTGCGMDEETQNRLFEPFYTTKGDLGNGLGLSTAYGIVKQHDGAIFVDSKLGQGSTFYVCLPLINAPEKKIDNSGKFLLKMVVNVLYWWLRTVKLCGEWLVWCWKAWVLRCFPLLTVMRLCLFYRLRKILCCY
jgi:PAS domain S-box-containing protein